MTAAQHIEIAPQVSITHHAPRRQRWIGYLFILPWFISMIWFDAIPFGMNLYLGLTDYSVGPIEQANWIGLDNYERMVDDELFRQSLSNTIYYIVISVPLTLALAFGIALLLNTRIRFLGLFRTVYYLPSIIPIVAASVIFLWMFNARSGTVNQLLFAVGIKPIRWLTNPDYVKLALIMISLWGFGAQMIIFLAALQGIPEQLYEAVAIDGGGLWARLRHIVIPLMTPTIFFQPAGRAYRQLSSVHDSLHHARPEWRPAAIRAVLYDAYLQQCLSLLRNGLCSGNVAGDVLNHPGVDAADALDIQPLGLLRG